MKASSSNPTPGNAKQEHSQNVAMVPASNADNPSNLATLIPAIIESLPKRSRDIIVAIALEGVAVRDFAETHKITSSNAFSSYQRARKFVCDKLAEIPGIHDMIALEFKLFKARHKDTKDDQSYSDPHISRFIISFSEELGVELHKDELKSYDAFYKSNFEHRTKERSHRLVEQPKPPISNPSETRAELLVALAATVPPDAKYDELAQAYSESREGLDQRLMPRLVASLKEELQGREHDSYAKKLDAVRWFNAELRKLDLDIAFRDTGMAATLTVDPGGRGNEGRFRLRSKTKAESGKHDSFHTQDIAELLNTIDLTSKQRREPLTEWRSKIAREGGETQIG